MQCISTFTNLKLLFIKKSAEMNYKNEKQSLTVLDSWSSISEKTVFVLDRSQYFTHVSSGHSIEGDFMKDSTSTSDFTIKPFDRSLWTCAVEAVVGYSRLVWDLFTPDQKCISIVAGGLNDETAPDRAARPFHLDKICTWKDEDQNLDHLLKALARRSHCHQIHSPDKLFSTQDIASFPNCGPDSQSILNSLDQALNDLAYLTTVQQERHLIAKKQTSTIPSSSPMKQQLPSTAENIDNNGRIILISSFQNEESIHEIVQKFELSLKRKNESLSASGEGDSTSSTVCPINYCDLVIINTFPVIDNGPCSTIENFSEFKPHLHVKTYSVRSGRIIGGLLNNLCLQHHNLRSTTITGIPMKEEQNASSSSQYDVEIVHCSSIHEDILKSNSPLLEGVVEQIDRNGFPCDTFKLQWYTPRVSNVDLYHCLAASRITAVDVNSRPSACLTNFLLSGRQVLLEIFKSKSNRIATHVLASHNGELYIHSLATTQPKLIVGDPPSINENLGGKVADYRMNDFVDFMKQHTLCKLALTIEDPLNRSTSIIKRQTLYWPIVLGHTILLNVPSLLGPILIKIPKESMSSADVEECKCTIDNLIKAEKEGHALPSITILDIIKSSNSSSNRSNSEASRLNQLYKLLWNELEYFLRVHSTTPEHEAILDYLLERHVGGKSYERGTKRAASKSTVVLSSSPSKKIKPSSQLLPEISDSAMIASRQQATVFYKTGLSLYQTWCQLYHIHHRSKSKLPFAGRTNQRAVLYQQLSQQSVEHQAT